VRSYNAQGFNVHACLCCLQAQLHFNMQLVLQQRSGASSRPLVVRRAAAQKALQVPSMAGGTVMVAPYQQEQLQQAYAAGLTRGAMLSAGDMGYAAVPTTAPQAAAGEGGLPQLALTYSPGSLPASSSGLQAAQVYYDTHGAPVTLVPYWQQQQQQQPTQQQQQQAQQQHQQLWQPQQQQQQQQLLPSAGVVVPSPVHCQGAPAGQYAAPVLLPVSEGFPQVMQVQQGSWQQQQQQGAAGLSQQQQQQQSYMAAGYDIIQVQGVAGIPASGPLTYTPMEFAQPQPSGLSGLMVSSVPQVNPAAQQLPLSGGVQQGTPALTGRSSLPSAGNVLLGSSAGSSSSSAVGPLLTYQQLGSHHSLSIPLSAEQLSMINSQLSSVAAMSGTSITAEHNFACGSLAVNVVASSQQQLNVAWQFIQSLLGQQGSTGAPAPEGLM